jgi:hypothetical protein
MTRSPVRANDVEGAALEGDAFCIEFKRLGGMLRVRQFDEIASNQLAILQNDDLDALRFIIGDETKP